MSSCILWNFIQKHYSFLYFSSISSNTTWVWHFYCLFWRITEIISKKFQVMSFIMSAYLRMLFGQNMCISSSLWSSMRHALIKSTHTKYQYYYNQKDSLIFKMSISCFIHVIQSALNVFHLITQRGSLLLNTFGICAIYKYWGDFLVKKNRVFFIIFLLAQFW